MRTPFITLATISLLALGACSTPLQQCVSNAQEEQAQISARIGVAQGNIERGYAIHRQSVPYTFTGVCYDNLDVQYACEKSDTRTEETPVAIDIAEERQKLADLQRQYISAKTRADAEIIQCRILHPQT